MFLDPIVLALSIALLYEIESITNSDNKMRTINAIANFETNLKQRTENNESIERTYKIENEMAKTKSKIELSWQK